MNQWLTDTCGSWINANYRLGACMGEQSIDGSSPSTWDPCAAQPSASSSSSSPACGAKAPAQPLSQVAGESYHVLPVPDLPRIRTRFAEQQQRQPKAQHAQKQQHQAQQAAPPLHYPAAAAAPAAAAPAQADAGAAAEGMQALAADLWSAFGGHSSDAWPFACPGPSHGPACTCPACMEPGHMGHVHMPHDVRPSDLQPLPLHLALFGSSRDSFEQEPSSSDDDDGHEYDGSSHYQGGTPSPACWYTPCSRALGISSATSSAVQLAPMQQAAAGVTATTPEAVTACEEPLLWISDDGGCDRGGVVTCAAVTGSAGQVKQLVELEEPGAVVEDEIDMSSYSPLPVTAACMQGKKLLFPWQQTRSEGEALAGGAADLAVAPGAGRAVGRCTWQRRAMEHASVTGACEITTPSAPMPSLFLGPAPICHNRRASLQCIGGRNMPRLAAAVAAAGGPPMTGASSTACNSQALTNHFSDRSSHASMVRAQVVLHASALVVLACGTTALAAAAEEVFAKGGEYLLKSIPSKHESEQREQQDCPMDGNNRTSGGSCGSGNGKGSKSTASLASARQVSERLWAKAKHAVRSLLLPAKRATSTRQAGSA